MKHVSELEYWQKHAAYSAQVATARRDALVEIVKAALGVDTPLTTRLLVLHLKEQLEAAEAEMDREFAAGWSK